MKSIAEKSFEMTGLFEAEILVMLMLKFWQHPLADDKEYRDGLLQDASGALQEAIRGVQLIGDMPADALNFVAAVWCAEENYLASGEADPATIGKRKAWLSTVRQALPSCFCDPSDLHDI